MSQPVGYADDWLEIATEIKQTAGYRCSSCGLRCLSASNSYRHLDLSLRRRLCAQVHHIDGNPSHNFAIDISSAGDRGCHLRMHRHRPQPTPGQLALKLKLPKSRRLRQSHSSFQLTFTDLINRLPRLPILGNNQFLAETAARA